MNKTLLLWLLLLLPLSAQQISLPHYLTPVEKKALKTYVSPQGVRGYTSPPPNAVRTMAEWEELQGLMITWTSYYDILSRIVDYAQEEVTVYIVCSDSNQVKYYLQNHGVELKNLKFLIEDYDTVWCRDYGPWTAYETGSDTQDIIDWIYNRPRPEDDVIPSEFADYMGLPEYEASQAPDDLTHTGGNFMVDGHGTGFSSKLILDENSGKSEAEIDDIMKRYLGLTRYIKMEVLPYDEIHHIDMHMKLLDEETLLVGEYPEGVADGPQIEANLQYVLNNFSTCYGRDYQVVRIPMPPDAYGRYPDEGGDYRTYTNSVIVNKTVIVPTYEEQYDSTALRIYREAMPGYHIVGIDCNDIITALGAIHCITKEVGADNPLLISHAAIRYAYDTESEYDVIAQITTNSGVSAATLFWSVDTTQGFTQQPMSATANDSFYASIPGQPAGTEVFYYLSATSGAGKTISKPLVAPAGLYTFTVARPSALSDNEPSLAESFRLEANYPNPFNPRTRITYRLRQAGQVTLTVYNALGQKVRTLVNRRQAAGVYQLIFNGEGLNSGLYFYRLQAGSLVQTRKMILMK